MRAGQECDQGVTPSPPGSARSISVRASLITPPKGLSAEGVVEAELVEVQIVGMSYRLAQGGVKG